MKDDLGDRMKRNYENRARHYLTRRTPVIIRVDGQAFHTYTRGMSKPFDEYLIDAMMIAAATTMGRMQGAKACYVQSDEASFLLTDYDHLSTQAWFDYNKSKIETATASAFTAWFNIEMEDLSEDVATFDARAFNVPKEEVTNYFLWRGRDWVRNSVTMLARHHFSHKELEGKGQSDMHEMMHKRSIDWTRLPPQFKNGTWVFKGEGVRSDVEPRYENIASILDRFLGE